MVQSINLFGEGVDLEKTIKDSKLTHLSTWMLVKDPALTQTLN